MQIRVGDSTFRASQLEKCWKAMQERVAGFDREGRSWVLISRHPVGFAAEIVTFSQRIVGRDADSPFFALAACIIANADQFRAWGIEVEEGK